MEDERIDLSGVATRAGQYFAGSEWSEKSGGAISSPFDPIVVKATSLIGQGRPQWDISARKIRGISTTSVTGTSHIAFYSDGGAIAISMREMQDIAFYIECMIRTPAADTQMHWDANIGIPNHPYGTMQRISGDHHFFAVPFTTSDRDVTHVNISQHTPAGGSDEHWTFREMVLYPVQRA